MSRSSHQCFSSTAVEPTHYQNEIVRDLCWLIHSPCLMQLPESLRAGWLFDLPDIEGRLQNLDQNPAPLLRCLRQQAQFRLGYYFEDLVRMYLKYFIQPIEYKSNIQVFHNKTTVGEYDFLIQLPDSRKVHLETAVKFYLCTRTDGSMASLTDFIGPNLSDRLDHKWHRLMDHQLNLSRTMAGSSQARALDLEPDMRSLLLRGYLFYHYDQWQEQQAELPIHRYHQRGWWLSAERQEKIQQPRVRYCVLMKPCWLSEAQPRFQSTLSFTELEQITRSITTPLLVARLEQVNGRLWTEMDRGFIVPPNWNL